MIPGVGSQHKKIERPGGFYSTPELEKQIKESHDHVVSGNILNKSRITMDKFQNALTVYPAKGLSGSINSNFYEFLTMGMVPYLIGSGMLMAVFNIANKHFQRVDEVKASNLGKRMALGVVLYGLMKNVSKKFIEVPVAWKTGIDVNMPYKTTKSELPEFPNDKEDRKAFEYHKVFESVDFPRWDLLYDMKEDAPRNYYYDKIAAKMGMGKDLVDSDQEVKSKIRETVIRTKVWSTLSSYIWAGLGVAVAFQDNWVDAFVHNNSKLEVFSKDFLKRAKNGFVGSVKQLYEGGANRSPIKASAGKAFIGAAIGSSVLGAVFSMYDFFGKRSDVIKGKIDYDNDYTVG